MVVINRKNNHNFQHHQCCFYNFYTRAIVDLSRRKGDDYDPIRHRLLWLFIVASEIGISNGYISVCIHTHLTPSREECDFFARMVIQWKVPNKLIVFPKYLHSINQFTHTQHNNICLKSNNCNNDDYDEFSIGCFSANILST